MIKLNSRWKFITSLILAIFLATFTCTNFGKVDFSKSNYEAGYFVLSFIGSALIFFLGGFKIEIEGRVYKIVSIAVFVFSLFSAMNVSVLYYNEYLGTFYLYLLNVFVYTFFAAIAFALTRSFRVSALTALVISAVYNTISFVVYSFRGLPLAPTDFMAFTTAMTVVSQYTFHLKYQMITCIILYTFHIMLAFKFPIKLELKRKKWRFNLIALAVAAVIVIYIVNVDYSRYTISVYSQRDANRNAGSAIGFYVNATRIGLDEPDNYNADQLNERLTEYNEGKTDLSDKPNIIAIMNESFADLRSVGDFNTSQEYLPYFYSITENTIKGTVLVSPFGGGTCNSEYEFLTGMTTGLLPSQTMPYMHNIDSKMQYSLVSHLESMGYKTLAMHPYYQRGWQRKIIYDYMGFDDFISIEDFEVLNEENTYLRQYISDDCNYKTLLRQLYSKGEGEKAFIFNVTMQNHGGFDHPGFEPDVLLEGMEGDYPLTEQYLTSIRHSDLALNNLLTELKNYPEDVVVLIFGDHLPNVEREFYEELYGNNIDYMTDEEKTGMYTTPFMIWTNYDIKEKSDVRSSPCFLSNILMEVAGLPKSRVQLYLDDLQQEVMQINPYGYYDTDGEWHTHDEYPELSTYYNLQYSLLKGKKLEYNFEICDRHYDVVGDHVISPYYFFDDERNAIIEDYKER